MPSAWIQHVKAYHSKHGGAYSAALKAASKTWKKGTGSKSKKVKKKRGNK